jgi:hypothetical protein
LPVDVNAYSDPNEAIRWLDIDPSFDSDWAGWSILRTYAYVPGLRALMDPLSPVNYHRLAAIASSMQSDLHESGHYSGLIKHENLTIEQMKFVTGTLKNEQGLLKPLRLDKVLLGIYAVNHELDRLSHSPIRPKIFLSAFGIRGLSKRFNDLDKDAKTVVREGLAEALDQSPMFASELLKGNKVSLDAAIGAYNFLSNHNEFKRFLAGTVAASIETPSQRHTAAAQHEDFSKGRLDPLPAPYKRPPPW